MTAREMVLVGFMQAQNCSNYPASWRHPDAAPDFLNEARTSRARRRNTVAWAHFYHNGLTKLGTMSESEDDEEDEEDEEEESPPPPPPRRPPLIDEDGYVPPPPREEPSRCVVS